MAETGGKKASDAVSDKVDELLTQAGRLRGAFSYSTNGWAPAGERLLFGVAGRQACAGV